jgi:hypothetical protein
MAATLNFKFVANAAGLKQGVDDASNKLTGFQKTTEGVSKKLKLALGAVSFVAIVKGLTDAAKAASEDQIAQDKLALQIKTSTDATDLQIKSNEAFITSMSKNAGVADDVLRPALANAVRGTGDLSKAQELLKIGLDGAAATGKPLETVMKALTQAQNGNTTSLYKMAPQLKATKGGVDDFAKSVAGAAGTSASPFAKFSVALDEAKETIGAAFLPVLEKLITTLGPLIDKIAPILAKLIGALAPIVTDLVDAFLPLIEAILPPVIDLLAALMPIISPLVKILTTFLVPIINILAGAFKILVSFITPILKGFASMGDGLKTAFSGIGNFFKGIVNGLIGMFEGFINFFIDGINIIPKALNTIKFKVPDWVPFIGGKEIGFKVPVMSHIKIPRLADGGLVMPSPGGSIVNVGEAGQAEAIIPLSKLSNMGGGNTYVININRAALTGEDVIRAIQRYQTGQGRVILNA